MCPTIEAASAKVVSSLDGKVQDRRIVMNGDGILLTDRGVKVAHIKRNFFTGTIYKVIVYLMEVILMHISKHNRYFKCMFNF